MPRLPILTVVCIVALLGGGPGAGAAQDAAPAPTPEPGFVALFDGTEASFAAWRPTGDGPFALVDGTIVTGSDSFDIEDLSLLYYAPRTFGDFVLRLQFRVSDPADNSGVFVRFRDPSRPIPADELFALDADAVYPNRDAYTVDGSWIAVDTGFEVQIDDAAEGHPTDPSVPDGMDIHRTGAIYNVPVGGGTGQQAFRRAPDLQPGEWNDLEVEVVGDAYTVRLNGQQTTTFTNPEPRRGKAPAADPLSGYVGIQTNPFIPGHVDFRAIRIRELPAAATPTP